MRNNRPSIHLSLLDRAICAVSPKAGIQRIRAKAAMSALHSTGYITSGSKKRTMRSWFPHAKSGDEDTLPKVNEARADSRDLYMTSAVATATLKRIKTFSVGSGLYLQSRIDRDVLGLNDEKADKIQAQIEREFYLWASSKLCDITATENFFELQGSVLFNTCLSGDVFILLPYVRRTGMPYDLRIKMIEADYCCNENGVPDSRDIAGGIKLDKDEAPIEYHFKKARYGEFANKWVKVPAFGAKSGRRNVLHPYIKERPGQRRGMPSFTPVVEDIKMLKRLSDSEIMASVISSFYTVFIKSQSPVGGLAGSYPVGNQTIPTDEDGTPTNPLDKNLYEMGSGNMIELDTDEDITIADPKRPNAAFDPFFISIVKQIGAALEIPFEVLLLHFTASYSASRAALLVAWKFFMGRRIWLTRNFIQPTFEELMTEAYIRGRLPLAGFLDDPIVKQAWCGSVWVGTGMGMIDPLKETKAAELRKNVFFSTCEDEYLSINGGYYGSWEALVKRRKREIELTRDAEPPEEPIETDETSTLEELKDNQ